MTVTHPIKEYFRGKNVLITGGTGFIGKALIEKLLRSTDIGIIYLIIRPKKGRNLQERVEQIVSTKLFEKLKKLKPESIQKIQPIRGDIGLPGLGLSDQDRNLLIKTVHLVYQVAASVRFDDFLRDAILVNLRSAREAALLALEMKNIEVYIHVSTTYCNIENRKVVNEVLYPPFGKWQEAITVAEKCDSHILNILAQKYSEMFPNTYTYTKRLAEHCINDMLVGKVPTIICRPSIVVSSLVEPFQGYIDSFNGPVGLLMAGGSGVLRTAYGDVDIITDYVPVDNVVKMLVVSTWEKAISRDKELTVFHASKSNRMEITMKMALELGKKLYWEVPFERRIWFPGNTMTKCFYNYYINVILFHILPALVIDLLLRLTGHSPFLFKLQKKIYIGNLAIAHFSLNDWIFLHGYSVRLQEKELKQEMIDFNFSLIPRGNEFYEYYLKSGNEARVILLKENEKITEAVRVRNKRMYYLDRTVKAAFFAWVTWTLFSKINILVLVFKWLFEYWKSL